MWISLEYTYWIVAILILPAAGLLVRLFVLQHDCGHGSLFPSRRANNLTGRLLSVLTFTPYDCWRKAHNLHHACSGHLDRRGVGGVDTLTVREYRALSSANKLAYRLYRNPFVMILFGAPYNSLIGQRFFANKGLPFNESYRSLPFKKVWKSVLSLNLALVLFYGTLGMLFGFKPLLVIVLPVVIIASWIGGWLFFIQHQFEEAYWEKNENWNFHDAAVLGSSHYVLPPLLQWFTGNIGLHHIHHLCAKIPNYRLQECLEGSPVLQEMNRLNLGESLECACLALWDEDRRKMIAFSDVG
ncbi:MAG: fatty acid desaturase [Micavibrio sp.]|nr:fatty acid desaturase [Micavibrio sp.]|tara:strand:+ start:6010 stop:6906 length:897 start_codon:yes stop_codon:yes gene_type:complete